MKYVWIFIDVVNDDELSTGAIISIIVVSTFITIIVVTVRIT